MGRNPQRFTIRNYPHHTSLLEGSQYICISKALGSLTKKVIYVIPPTPGLSRLFFTLITDIPRNSDFEELWGLPRPDFPGPAPCPARCPVPA